MWIFLRKVVILIIPSFYLRPINCKSFNLQFQPRKLPLRFHFGLWSFLNIFASIRTILNTNNFNTNILSHYVCLRWFYWLRRVKMFDFLWNRTLKPFFKFTKNLYFPSDFNGTSRFWYDGNFILVCRHFKTNLNIFVAGCRVVTIHKTITGIHILKIYSK